VSFEFCHDGHCYLLDTDDGEVHCREVAEQPQPEQPLEPSEDTP
jgi:hypothetical protein